MRKIIFSTLWSLFFVSMSSLTCQAEMTTFENNGYSIETSVDLPVSPEIAYAVMTGDISGWWDHSMTANPYKYYIEAKPGGGFIEIFDESGDGARHAVVIYAKKGEMLRFDGPLGLSGFAIDFVTTWKYAATETGCRVDCLVNTSGQIDDEWANAVASVWKHFLIDQLKPYIESGKYLEDKPHLRGK